jgi:hypothetical protein
MAETRWQLFLCNGATDTFGMPADVARKRRLEYDPASPGQNVHFDLPEFVIQLGHLDPRALDLVEIAAYIYCADRSVSRGGKDVAVYTSWTQHIALRIKVRDHAFWSRPGVAEGLAGTVNRMSGLRFRFEFEAGRVTPPVGLLDRADLAPDPTPKQIVLFSGGLDSLTGACQALEEGGRDLYLVSHRTQNTAYSTQHGLHRALTRGRAAGRVNHIVFTGHLKGEHAAEETQRTRFFLYAALAYAVSTALGEGAFYVFENGITSLNLPKSQQMMNARNSRTTHPRTLADIRTFLSLVYDGDFRIYNPFAWLTKADVVGTLIKLGYGDYLSSSVSCSKTFDPKVKGLHTHCGRCSQCIDRRIAIYATEQERFDNEALYGLDFVTQDIESEESLTILKDYMRQAYRFATASFDDFVQEWLDELADIVPALDTDETTGMERVYQLCKAHGEAALHGAQRMRLKEDLKQPRIPNTLIQILEGRDYLQGVRRESETAAARRLANELHACPVGKEHFAVYENIGIAILSLLFPSALGPPRTQERTLDGRQRRDVFFPNNRSTRFFDRIAVRYGSDLLLVDFKNYGDPIGPEAVRDVAAYPNDAIGRFALIVSRQGGTKEAFSQQTRLIDKERKYLVVLSDADLDVMLQHVGASATLDRLLNEALDDLLVKV